jgi:predicted HicB family RNase H-like nuclease
MVIDGHKAIVQYDPEIDMFRGEFIGLSGGADFYSTDVVGLKSEGSTSLKVYLDMCREKGFEPYKSYSGKFNVRILPELHATAVAVASAKGQSLNEFITEAIEEKVN